RIDDYLFRYPELRSDSKAMSGLTYEEFRLRRQYGEAPSADEYRQRFSLDDLGWPIGAEAPALSDQVVKDLGKSAAIDLNGLSTQPGFVETRRADGRENPGSDLFDELHRANPQAAHRLARALLSFPEAGSDFLGYRLIRTLGAGAFGKVYLAEQPELAGRPVA